MQIAVLGAGPVGLECALYARALGHRPVVWERGEPARNVERWGFVELFSPWPMDVSPLGLETLRRAGRPLPPSEGRPTGRELRERYLLPLAEELGEAVRPHHEVLGVARDALLKTEAIGDPARGHRPFRLLVRDLRNGEERWERAGAVVDATGVYDTATGLGPGGLPVPGEAAAGDRLTRHLPDLAGPDRAVWAGRRTLLMGSGYSAGTALLGLLELAGEAPGTEVVWAWRAGRPSPLPRIPDDPLPERDRIAREANRAAEALPPGLTVRPSRTLLELRPAANGRLRARLGPVPAPEPGTEDEELEVDRVLGLAGYRPDTALSRELQVHSCYATEGPMQLAAALLGSEGGDCLQASSPGPGALRHPEPGFFVIGHKSYGRRSDFLLRTGREQVRDLFRLLEDDPRLDLDDAVPGPGAAGRAR